MVSYSRFYLNCGPSRISCLIFWQCLTGSIELVVERTAGLPRSLSCSLPKLRHSWQMKVTPRSRRWMMRIDELRSHRRLLGSSCDVFPKPHPSEKWSQSSVAFSWRKRRNQYTQSRRRRIRVMWRNDICHLHKRQCYNAPPWWHSRRPIGWD